MRKKNLWKKTASVIIAAAMIMSAVPVYAATQEQPAEVVVQGTTDEETEEEGGDVVEVEENVGEETEGQPAESSGTVQVGNETYSSLADAIDANRDKIDPVTMTIHGTVEWETGATHNSTPFEMATSQLTLVGADENAVFKATGVGVGAIRLAGGADNQILTFKNLKVVDESCYTYENGEHAWEFTYLEFAGNIVFENVAFDDGVLFKGDTVTCKNCSFSGHNNDSSALDNVTMYGAWVANGTATFEQCTFSGTRGLKTHEKYGTNVQSLIVDNCTFGPLSEKPGVVIGALDHATNVSVTNCSFNNCQPGDQQKWIYESDTDVSTFGFCLSDNVVSPVEGQMSGEALLACVKDGVITLDGDVTVTTTAKVTDNLTIDLNGHTITGKTTDEQGCRVFQILNGEVKLTGSGTVKVIDSGINEGSSVIRVGDDSVQGTPTLTIDSDVKIYTNQCYGVTVFGSQTEEALVVKGKIETTNVPAISGNGSVQYGGTRITLEKGSKVTTANHYAIYHPQSGELNINGKVEGNGGIEAKAGNTNIGENASITAIAKEQSYGENNNGTSTQGYAIAVVENKNYAGGAKVSIAGGTVTGKVIIVQDNDVTEDKKGSISITGGTFSSNPSAYVNVVEGYHAHANEAGNKWGVSTTEGHNYNYKIEGYNYYCICGDSVYIPPYTPPQPTTPPATTDTVTNPDGSTTSTTTQENTDGSTTTTVVDKDSNGNVTGTTETTEKTTGNTTTKTETATTVDGAQTVTETTTVKNQDGSTEETKKVTDKDANGNVTGTTETVEKTEGNTTTTKETTTAADGSQTVTESTLVKNEDGSSEEKATITAADGSVTNVTTTTQTDGSATEVKETSEKNDAGNTVDVTATTKTDSNGDVTSVKEQSVITNVADNTSATVNVLKDGEDNVKYSRATVNKTVDEDTTRVKLEGPVVDQIESASGTSNVTITMNVNTDDGDTKYSLKVATKNLQAGNKLYVYKENPETGERTMVNSLLYTVAEDGSVTFNTKQNANFVLVNKASAAALNKAIKKTLTAAKPSSSVKAGKKIKMALNPNLNMENVKSVKYSTTQSSVAKVSSNGTITAKKAGIVSIKAMITLKNGYIKTVTTKITVKE